MTDLGAAAMRGPGRRWTMPHVHGRSGLIDGSELVAALDHAAERQVTIISAPAGSGKPSLLHAWADGPG